MGDGVPGVVLPYIHIYSIYSIYIAYIACIACIARIMGDGVQGVVLLAHFGEVGGATMVLLTAGKVIIQQTGPSW